MADDDTKKYVSQLANDMQVLESTATSLTRSFGNLGDASNKWWTILARLSSGSGLWKFQARLRSVSNLFELYYKASDKALKATLETIDGNQKLADSYKNVEKKHKEFQKHREALNKNNFSMAPDGLEDDPIFQQYTSAFDGDIETAFKHAEAVYNKAMKKFKRNQRKRNKAMRKEANLPFADQSMKDIGKQLVTGGKYSKRMGAYKFSKGAGKAGLDATKRIGSDMFNSEAGKNLRGNLDSVKEEIKAQLLLVKISKEKRKEKKAEAKALADIERMNRTAIHKSATGKHGIFTSKRTNDPLGPRKPSIIDKAQQKMFEVKSKASNAQNLIKERFRLEKKAFKQGKIVSLASNANRKALEYANKITEHDSYKAAEAWFKEKKYMERIKDFVSRVGKAFMQVVVKALMGFLVYFPLIIIVFMALRKAFKPVKDWAKKNEHLFIQIKDQIIELYYVMKELFRAIFDGDIIKVLKIWFTQVLPLLAKILFNVAKVIVKLLWVVLKSVIGTLIDTMKTLFGYARDWLIGWADRNLSFFANGGTVNTPLQIVGERGPELVSLPKGSQVYPNGMAVGGGGSTTINVHVNGRVGASDSEIRDIANKVAKEINLRMNRTSTTGTGF
jgi:hypothetical protein